MKLAAVLGLLFAAALAACSDTPGTGPANAGAIIHGGRADGTILYDVVKVDDRVVATLRAAPQPSFRTLFAAQGKPPPPRIAVGDRLAVVIWEAGPGGLFTAPLPALAPSPNPTIEPLEEPPTNPGNSELNRLLGTPSPSETAPGQPPESERGPQSAQAIPPAAAASGSIAALVAAENQRGAVMPEQVVARDGTITIPYAGQIAAAGRTPAEVQREIEASLAKKAIEPQALVIDRGGPAHTVAVAGAVVHGARIALSPAGDRVLQVIAEAGGAHAPVHELFVRLSRGDVTATLPLDLLVREPAENVYAWPGDVITLIRLPQAFSVFGAAKRNAQIPFGAATLNLSQALGKAHWLVDEVANARGVFLFRYENDDVVRALGEPLATAIEGPARTPEEPPGGVSPSDKSSGGRGAGAQGGVSAIVYRFDMKDAKYYFLARQFPMHDRDVIFVVDADIIPLFKWFRVLSKITGPVEEGFIVCFTTKNC
jgi:polysaccharide export outer membrane protein